MNEEEKERIERIRKYGDLLTRSGTSTSLEKELQLSAFNRYVGDMYDKTKKYADEEFEMITGNRREEDTATTSSKEPTIQDVVDFVRNPVKTVSDSFSQSIADVKNNMIDKSREENTLLNAYNAVSKRMVENYENMTPEEYYKDQLLRQRLEDEIKKQNSGIFKTAGNWINTGLRGIQSHVANAESALFAAATNNPAADLGARLALGENATEENVEKVKQQMYGNLRENWISQGEKDIARQQQLNDVAYDGVAKMAMDAAFTVGDMTIPILAGIATSGVASEANVGADAAAKIAQATSLGSMYTSVYGGSYKEALDAGATTRAADMYAHAMALIEIGTELIGGETLLSMMAGKPVNSLLGKLTKGKLSTVRNRLVKGLVAGFIDIGGESVEEALSAIVSPIARKAILGGEDINMPDYFAGIYQDAIGALLPTAMLVGIGRPALVHQINAKEAETIDYIKKEADFIPKEVKGDLIRKIQEVTADARFGINENYTKVYDAVYDELRKANAKNAEVFNNVDLLERSINRSGQPIITPSLQDTLQNRPQAQTAQLSPRDLGRLAQQQGYVYEPYTGETTQELLDYSKKVPVTYSNMEQINDEIAQAMAEDSDIISITPVTEINQVEQNFKDILEKKYPNKQVVYADIQSKPGTVFRGLTSNNDTNTLILKAGQSAKDLLGSGYHEIGHQAKISNPTLYNEFVKEAGLEGENNAKVNDYRDAWGLEGYDDDAIREEMFGNYLGEINTKPENVANVEESTRTMFDNLKELGNKVANKAVGSEINNTRLTAYNLEGNTYMNGDIINNEEFEKHAIEELNGKKEETKPAPKKLAPQPKTDITPKIAEAAIEDEESEVEKNLKQIRERIKQGDLKQKIDIDKAIADVLKIPYKLNDRNIKKYSDLLERSRTKFSAQKTEKDTDKIIQNQRNEIASQEKKIEQLTEKNKTQREDIAELEKLVRKDNASYQRAVKLKGYKLEKQGNKLQAQTEKNKTMKEYTDILRYEKMFIRHAGASQYRFDADDMLRYTMLRVVDGMNDSKAWKATLEFKEAMNYIPNELRGALKSINWFLSPKIYNKLPNELKEQVDKYKKFYRKNITITPKMMTNMKAISDYIKENLLNQKPVTKAVLNKMLPTDDAPIALSDIIKTKEEADAFVKKVAELDSAIKAERERKIKVEDAAKLFPKLMAPLDELDGQLIAKKKEEPIGFARKIDKAKKQIYTLKTEIESVYGGDPNTPALFLERNLQKGERGKRTVINAAYDFFKDFMQESKGLNGLMKMYRWKPEYEKLFAHNAEWKEWVKGTPKMPKSFILSLYLHRNNDQNLAHITGAVTSVKVDEDGKVVPHERQGGGIRLPNERQYKAGEIADAYKNGTNKKLTLQQVDALIGTLTKEEKAFADKVKAFYEYTTDLINEVSNRVFDYDLATVENYFPIHAYLLEQMYSNKEFDVETLLNGYKAEFTNLFNQGQLKEREDSFAPIYLENLVDVLSKSVNDISTFYGYAEPLRENDIVLKYVFHDGKEREANSIEAQLNKLDPDLLKDYKSIVRFITGADGFGKRPLRNWQAINTLTFNVGTWFTQPASFMNTMKYYDTTGDFVKALASSHTKVNQMIRDYYEKAGVDTKGMSNFELMRFFVSEATPILDARAINFRIPGLKELTEKKLNDKIKAKFLQFFDDIAVSTIARMQIYNTAAQAEFGTTEYFEKLRDNLELVMGETQPDSSPVNKANIFRSKNVFAQSLSLFGTPANQIANNVVQSSINLKYALQNGTEAQKKTAWSRFSKMVGGVIASNLWVALVRSLRDVVRSDDEDETEFQDRFIAQFLISALSPTLVGDEIASWIMSKAKYGGVSFYDLDTPDTAFVNNVFGAANKITNLFNEEISPTKKVVDSIKAIGSVAPIDTRSLIHDTEAMLKYFFPDTYKTYSLSKNTEIYKAWQKDPSTPMAEFYTAYTATRKKELEKLGYHKADKEKNIKSNLKETREKALKNVFKDNAKVKKYMEILFGYKD